MLRSSKRTLVAAVVLGLCAPGVLSLTITGPSSAQSNGSVTFTWTSVSTDPTSFEIDIDEDLESLASTDPYFIQPNVDTASGSTTFPLPSLSVGVHRIAFSSNDGFTIYTTGNLTILAAASSSIPSSSSAPASSPPPSSTISPTSSSIPVTSSSSQSSQTKSTQSLSPTGGSQNGVINHHTNTGAIAGGVVGAVVIMLLALLGWWYLRRRADSSAAGQESHGGITQFLATPVTTALAGAPVVNNRSDRDEFRPWEDNALTAVSSAATAAPTASAPPPSAAWAGSVPSAGAPSKRTVREVPAPTSAPAPAAVASTDRKQPIVMRWEPPAGGHNTARLDSGPSRDDLVEEVRRLREHIEIISPPAYPGPT
ncbi:hypothetical protein DFH07DRAFT_786688 [Mycena maculata]|uniref:Uncharacterized protein n=1 Tax=Mycena maculata TaxID=230809 RepID=A0AAD7P1Z7_9AGAR|nr:hypothetical protein DFH07DRAFT_786688 [Mycena maculata]